MALGKNKRSGKGGRKKQKFDAFARKEWYKVKVPKTFNNRFIGYTCVNKSSGNKNASDSLRGRVYEFYLGDLKRKNNTKEEFQNQATHDESEGAFRKVKLVCEEIATTDCLTNFAGMSMATEKLRGCIEKWATLIEAYADVRTSDGYLLRLFAMARTNKVQGQIRITSYAKSSKVREIRRKMVIEMEKCVATRSLEEVVLLLKASVVNDDIKKKCGNTFPIDEVHIRKVKVLKRPAADYLKIMSMHDAKDEGDDLPEQEIENADGMDAGVEDNINP